MSEMTQEQLEAHIRSEVRKLLKLGEQVGGTAWVCEIIEYEMENPGEDEEEDFLKGKTACSTEPDECEACQ